MTNNIDELLTEWAESERTGDAKKLDTLLTDDFVGIGPVGFVLDKKRGSVRFDHGLAYEQLELDEVSTRRHDDTAIVVAHQHARGSARGNPTPPDTRVSFTLVRDRTTSFASRACSTASSARHWERPSERRRDQRYRPLTRARWADKVLGWLLRHGRGPGFMRLLTVPVVSRASRGRRRWFPCDATGACGSSRRSARWRGSATSAPPADSTCTAATNARPTTHANSTVDAVPILRGVLVDAVGALRPPRLRRRSDSSDEAIAAEASRHPVFASHSSALKPIAPAMRRRPRPVGRRRRCPSGSC